MLELFRNFEVKILVSFALFQNTQKFIGKIVDEDDEFIKFLVTKPERKQTELIVNKKYLVYVEKI